jgi:hypothetical protein
MRGRVQQNDQRNKNEPNTKQTIDLIYWVLVFLPEEYHHSPLLSPHNQIPNQETSMPRAPHKDDGPQFITQWFTALLATWILLPYAKTLTYTHSSANTTRNQGVLAVFCFAANIHIVDGAIIDSINQTILQNAAQIKILDCFTAYQQRQHLEGYDSEETDDTAQHTDGHDTNTTIRGDAKLPTGDHLNVSVVNRSQGVAQYTRWSDLLEMATSKEVDIMVISEPAKMPQNKQLGGEPITPALKTATCTRNALS